MDWEVLSFVAAGIAVAVSLAAFIATGIRSIRTEIRAVGAEIRNQREKSQAFLRQQCKDHQAFVRQQREKRQAFVWQHCEDRTKLENAIASLAEKVNEISEMTARIEGILVSHGMLVLSGTVAQGIPGDEPREP